MAMATPSRSGSWILRKMLPATSTSLSEPPVIQLIPKVPKSEDGRSGLAGASITLFRILMLLTFPAPEQIIAELSAVLIAFGFVIVKPSRVTLLAVIQTRYKFAPTVVTAGPSVDLTVEGLSMRSCSGYVPGHTSTVSPGMA